MKVYLVVILFICGCISMDKTSRDVRHETSKYNRTPILVAVSHDTIPRFFVLNENSGFYFFEGLHKTRHYYQKFYAGTYLEHKDTLHLIFYKDHKPENMMPYMMRDSSGKYLIYPFKSGDLKTYLEISQAKY